MIMSDHSCFCEDNECREIRTMIVVEGLGQNAKDIR
jgi:hypothetical protein